MLTLSRMKPQHDAIFFQEAGAADPPAEEPRGNPIRRLVEALGQAGLAALAIDAATYATLAANPRFQALTARPGVERELKRILRSRPCEEQAAFVWRGAAGLPHLVRRFDLAEPDGPVAVFTLSDPAEEEALRFAAFVRRHRITRAESRLMLRLLAGETLAEIAAGLELSLPTIKSQLRSLLAKTGAGRQAALVAFYYSGGGRGEPGQDS